MLGIAPSRSVAVDIGSPATDEPYLKRLQALALKPGCWQVSVNTAQVGALAHASPDTYRQSMPNASPEQIAKIVATVNAQIDQQAAAARKGTNRLETHCPLRPDFAAEIIGQIDVSLGGVNCTHSVDSTASAIHVHRLCPPGNGVGGAEQKADFELADSKNFRGTIQAISHAGRTVVTTRTYVGKWTGESAPHIATPSAAIPGSSPLGPAAVAKVDPFRIIATSDGTPITARQGLAMISSVPPAVRRDYDARLPELLQKLYTQHAIAMEAVSMHLDRQAPWQTQLRNTQMQIFQGHQNYAGDPNIPPELMAQWVDAHDHILWNAYFSRAASKEDKQALLKQEQDKYKLTIVDAGFFFDDTHKR